MWPIRSFLFVPAHRPDWIEKACRPGPEAVILDMEDSVTPTLKPQARTLLKSEIEELRARGTLAFVRVNPQPELMAEDLAAAVTPGLAGVIVPKARTEAGIRDVHDLLSYYEGKAGMPRGEVCMIPLPETAEGMWAAHHLAKASSRVKGLLTAVGGPHGSADCAWAFGYRPTMDGREQIYIHSKIILDSRAAGAMYPLAGLLGTKLDDLAAVETLVRRSKHAGFTGAVVIHPSHVAVANAVFRPTPEEVEYYEGMLVALAEGERQGLGAVAYKGFMVDYAMLPLAREIVEEGRRVRDAGGPRGG